MVSSSSAPTKASLPRRSPSSRVAGSFHRVKVRVRVRVRARVGVRVRARIRVRVRLTH